MKHRALKQRVYPSTEQHDRDINAAININQTGLATLVGDTRY